MGNIFTCLQEAASEKDLSSPTKKRERKVGHYSTSGNTVVESLDEEESCVLEDTAQPGLRQTPIMDRGSLYSRIPPLVGRSSISSNPDIKKNNNNSSSAFDANIHAFFDQYKDLNEDLILAEGIERFCSDLRLQPDDFRVLVLAWKFGAEYMCKFSRSEFFHGCKSMKIDSVQGIQNKLPDLVRELSDKEVFRDFYKFTFRFGLDHDVGERVLPAETAVVLWKLVFTDREPEILQTWINFITEAPHIKGIPKDTWLMFLTFSENVQSDLSNYDESEAWPSIFDDFVESVRDATNEDNKVCV